MRVTRAATVLSFVLFAGACADLATAPGDDRLNAGAARASSTSAQSAAWSIYLAAEAKYGRPYQERACTSRVCAVLQALIMGGGVTETRIAVGDHLYGQGGVKGAEGTYPNYWWFTRLEYFVVRARGGAPWKLDIVNFPAVPQEGARRQWHNRNFTGLAAGDRLCVHTQIKGTYQSVTSTIAATVHTEHFTTCVEVKYAADVAVNSVTATPRNARTPGQRSDSVQVNDIIDVVANVSENLNERDATFLCVLTIGGIERDTQAKTLTKGATGTCAFTTSASPAGDDLPIVVTANNVQPGDANPANNVAGTSVDVYQGSLLPNFPPQTGGGSGGDPYAACRDVATLTEQCRVGGLWLLYPGKRLYYDASTSFDTTWTATFTAAGFAGGSVSRKGLYHARLHDVFWRVPLPAAIDRVEIEQKTYWSGNAPVVVNRVIQLSLGTGTAGERCFTSGPPFQVNLCEYDDDNDGVYESTYLWSYDHTEPYSVGPVTDPSIVQQFFTGGSLTQAPMPRTPSTTLLTPPASFPEFFRDGASIFINVFSADRILTGYAEVVLGATTGLSGMESACGSGACTYTYSSAGSKREGSATAASQNGPPQ